MILKDKVSTFAPSRDFKNADKSIVITNEAISNLNARIQSGIERNEREMLNGLNSDSLKKNNKGISL